MSNSIKREQHDEVVTLIFDQENSVANVFNEDMFAELNDQLDYIENNQMTSWSNIQKCKTKYFHRVQI